MTFRSLLHEEADGGAPAAVPPAPACLSDLRIDQVVDALAVPGVDRATLDTCFRSPLQIGRAHV